MSNLHALKNLVHEDEAFMLFESFAVSSHLVKENVYRFRGFQFDTMENRELFSPHGDDLMLVFRQPWNTTEPVSTVAFMKLPYNCSPESDELQYLGSYPLNITDVVRQAHMKLVPDEFIGKVKFIDRNEGQLGTIARYELEKDSLPTVKERRISVVSFFTPGSGSDGEPTINRVELWTGEGTYALQNEERSPLQLALILEYAVSNTEALSYLMCRTAFPIYDEHCKSLGLDSMA